MWASGYRKDLTVFWHVIGCQNLWLPVWGTSAPPRRKWEGGDGCVTGIWCWCLLLFEFSALNEKPCHLPNSLMLFWFLKPEEHNKGEKRKSWSRKWKIKILHLSSSLCLTNLGPVLHINQSILSLCVPAWVRRILIKKQEANNWGTQIYFLKWSSRFNEAWQNALSQ